MIRGLALVASLVGMVIVAGCGSGSKHGSATETMRITAPSLPLSQQVLAARELPRAFASAGSRRFTSTSKLVAGLEQFQPRVLGRRMREAGFKGAYVESLRGRGGGALANSPAALGGWSAVVKLGSASGAAQIVKFMHARTLTSCTNIKICDVFWSPIAVPDVRGAVGSQRSRKKRTSNGPAFQQYYVFFTVGSNAYGEAVGGPYGKVSKSQLIAGTQSLYRRLRR